MTKIVKNTVPLLVGILVGGLVFSCVLAASAHPLTSGGKNYFRYVSKLDDDAIAHWNNLVGTNGGVHRWGVWRSAAANVAYWQQVQIRGIAHRNYAGLCDSQVATWASDLSVEETWWSEVAETSGLLQNTWFDTTRYTFDTMQNRWHKDNRNDLYADVARWGAQKRADRCLGLVVPNPTLTAMAPRAIASTQVP